MNPDERLERAVWSWLDDKIALNYDGPELEPLLFEDVTAAVRAYEQRPGARVLARSAPVPASTLGGQHPPLAAPASHAAGRG
jgi:hypothetical protein